MNDIVTRTLNTVAANSYAKTHTPYQARNDAQQIRESVQRSSAAVSEFQRLDKKWNNGYASGETRAAIQQNNNLQSQASVLATYLREQTRSLSTFPSQKEYASETLKKLGGC
jgi:hypothetical protein